MLLTGFAGAGSATDTIDTTATVGTGVVAATTMQFTGFDVRTKRPTLDLARCTASGADALTVGAVLISFAFVSALATVVPIRKYQRTFSTAQRLSRQTGTLST